jgi:hypothetical protein
LWDNIQIDWGGGAEISGSSVSEESPATVDDVPLNWVIRPETESRRTIDFALVNDDFDLPSTIKPLRILGDVVDDVLACVSCGSDKELLIRFV